MAITDFAAFGEMHVSVLQEIGNMGAGNAATALSDMISAPTDISVPQVKIISSAQAASLTDTLSAKTAAYLIGVNGDMRGAMLFIFPFDFIGRLACTYFPGTEVKKREDMNEMVLSVVQETCKYSSCVICEQLCDNVGNDGGYNRSRKRNSSVRKDNGGCGKGQRLLCKQFHRNNRLQKIL